MSTPRVFHNLIGGEFVPAQSGKTFERRNPADTRDVVGIFADSDERDVHAAVEAAKAAFPQWSKVPAPKRGEILLRAAELLQARKEQYSRDLTREMGKPLFEAGGDIVEAIGMAQYAGSEGRRMHGVTTPSELPNKFQMSIRQPIGVVGLITPWNFPMAIASWKMLPAIVCGNTVVIKPGEDASVSTYNLVQCLMEAGLPPGVVNIVTGYGPRAGQPLVEHPDVPVISFTGSSRDRAVGIRIRCTADQAGKPGDGWEESVDRDARCRSRSGPRWRPVGRLWYDRPALYGNQPTDRPSCRG
ncbi:MAG: hypothetical protein KatS3mg056_1347 [Chloroflexus sp.]|nr:MAG: hypothetical protein KatS3mg056_1347 [Chloroflexus sp.]